MKIVLGSHAGGLGDHLLYSTLPELYAMREMVEIFISTQPTVNGPAFRNEETRALVWSFNPYVCGFVDEPPTVGEPHVWQMVKHSPRDKSPIARVERAHGFYGVNAFPRIYYQPQYRSAWAGRVVGDATSISQGFSNDDYEQFVQYLCRFEPFSPDNLVMLESAHQGHSGRTVFPNNRRHTVESIFEYCDIIFSCAAFFCVESGSNTLASAIRQYAPTPRIFSLFSTKGFNEQIFTWKNVHYVVIGGLNANYRIWD